MAYPNSNTQIRIREGKVTPITVPDDQLEELKKVLNSNRLTPYRKEAVQKRITGCCCICGGIPTMQVSYDVDGATRIEKYCDNCIKSVYSREAVL